MRFNRDVFFRQATLRICSSLKIDNALKSAYDYLNEFFPIDELFLDILDADLGAIRRIAHIRGGKVLVPELIVPLPEKLKNWLTGKDVPFIMDPADPHAQAMTPLVKLVGVSDLVVPLKIEGHPIGFLVLRAQGLGRYRAEQTEILSVISEPFAIALANALAHEAVLKYSDLLLDDNRFLQKELFPQKGDEIIGGNSGLRNVMETIRQVAGLSNTVLLLGETGTGKELIANAIHFSSRRKDGPFIKVNCGAIPESLIDSELFGHEKGAFTGATVEKRGRFERANGGTIFLDEVGELSSHAQVRLLRVLQNREIERVGGTRAIPVDIRVIAATHRNLENMVAENRFREDLWFRLNVFPIMVPPLRQRKEDIPALTRYFVELKSRELGIAIPPAIAPGALERLTQFDWPGNVRELENLTERELIRHKGGQLFFDGLLSPQRKVRESHRREERDSAPSQTLDEMIASYISKVLKATNGKIHGPGGAATVLGIKPTTLRARMDRLGIAYGRKKC
ncbi:sigma 54-interacting transcriptional regulator [Geomonas sp. Red32]|uniref:sigma-54-dependent Fis family transcriptional regulator n=1 Tax=Geomonas sp. Red32 TaxID=2912856 RepID=UPI00202D0361|nr:sigma 54-interacting transcriptional regulator [Geomonas sp. Red32]